MANNNNLKEAYDWKRMLSSIFVPKGKMSEREQDPNVDAFANAMHGEALEKLIGAQTESVLSGEKRDEGYGEYEPEDILSILQNVSQLGVQRYDKGGQVSNNNNNEQPSITEVFGEKSKDSDDMKNLMSSFLEQYFLSDKYGGLKTKAGTNIRKKAMVNEMLYQALGNKTGLEEDYPYGEVGHYADTPVGEEREFRPSNILDLVQFIDEFQPYGKAK